ncbi:MAG TPA: hypothetical protein VNO70_08000 [Blastocatellia bacterium]|nr:hypothetical protein [Blastocatellia bacterium]
MNLDFESDFQRLHGIEQEDVGAHPFVRPRPGQTDGSAPFLYNLSKAAISCAMNH